jgi:hypothetical protein
MSVREMLDTWDQCEQCWHLLHIYIALIDPGIVSVQSECLGWLSMNWPNELHKNILQTASYWTNFMYGNSWQMKNFKFDTW